VATNCLTRTESILHFDANTTSTSDRRHHDGGAREVFRYVGDGSDSHDAFLIHLLQISWQLCANEYELRLRMILSHPRKDFVHEPAGGFRIGGMPVMAGEKNAWRAAAHWAERTLPRS
jgi:hypothetical protein